MWLLIGLLVILFVLLLIVIWWKPHIVSYLFSVTNCTAQSDCNAGYLCSGPSIGPKFCIRQDCSIGGTPCPTGTACIETPEGLTCMVPPCGDSNDGCPPGTLCFYNQCLPVNEPCTPNPNAPLPYACQTSGTCINNECMQCDASKADISCGLAFSGGSSSYGCIPLVLGQVSGECVLYSDPRVNTACKVDADCTDPIVAKCGSNNLCGVCAQDSDCVGWYGAGEQCYEGICIQ